MSTFGSEIGFDGKPINTVFQYQMLGFAIDDAISKYGLLTPDYLKIDVDGIEDLVLEGGTEALSNAKSVIIEVNQAF